MRNQDTYKELKVFEFPNATVRVHIPDLTDDEQATRLERIKKASEQLLKGVLKNECRANDRNLF